ncbi:hypothetical protein NDU88_004946 [Pleurodeles waltl]|uniref:Protein piccolo n=1 Tax=Pleurodeles waltl TaxID=8319 RepID=A0AAV7SKB1_PLEWA|nr:hypothetical protein NDU88_004946 [Pleurodeles waltl]
MGNEASLEGGEGLPGGVSPADLSQLSEEERRQIAAVMSRAQELPKPEGRNPDTDAQRFSRTAGKPPEPGPSTISKSRTTDTFKTEQQVPGRSFSSMNLRDSKPEFKEEQKPSMMPSFLTESNPLSAVSSVVNKFSLFDVKSDLDAAQEEATRKQVGRKEQGKQEEPKSAKLAPQQEGQVLHQKQTGPTKTSSQQEIGRPVPQRSAAAIQDSRTPGASQQNPAKPSAQVKDSAKPLPLSSKPSSLQQAGLSAASSKHPTLTKPLPQHPETVTQSAQVSETLQQQGTVKHLPQQAGSSKPPFQQTGPAKALPPAKQDSHPAGSVKPSHQPLGPPRQTEPTKLPAQQASPAKFAEHPRPSDPSPQQLATAKHFPQTGPTKAPVKQPEPCTSSKVSSQTPAPKQVHLPDQQLGFGTQSKEQANIPVKCTEPLSQKTMCPLCTTTELLLHTPEKANYNTCTQCQITVCSLCGFNPNPHITEIKEWLCLNCQMQRALGMATSPVSTKKPMLPQQKTTSTSKQVSQPHQKADHTKTIEPKMPVSVANDSLLKSKQPVADTLVQTPSSKAECAAKVDQPQQSLVAKKLPQSNIQRPDVQTVSSYQASSVKAVPSHPNTQAPTPSQDTRSQKSEVAKAPQLMHPVVDADRDAQFDSKLQPHASQLQSDFKQVSTSKSGKEIRTETSLPTPVKEDPKKTPNKIDAKFDANPLPKRPQTALPQENSVKSSVLPKEPPKSHEQPRRFSLNLGSMTETPKHQPTTPQETVTGKLFGFGASIFSQASSFISTAAQPSSQPQGTQGTPAKQPPPSSQHQSAPGSPAKQPPPSSQQLGVQGSPAKQLPPSTQPQGAQDLPAKQPSPSPQTLGFQATPKQPSSSSQQTYVQGSPKQPPPPAQPQGAQTTIKQLPPSSETQNVQGSPAKKPSPSSQPHNVQGQQPDNKQPHPPAYLHTAEVSLGQQPAPQHSTPLPATKEPLQVHQPPKLTPTKKETKPQIDETSYKPRADLSSVNAKDKAHEQKQLPVQIEKESEKGPGPSTIKKPALLKTCPICKIELNVGSTDVPNFNTCTECRNIVCNLCGFNPTPHLTEVKEWLCLSCQTQRAMKGQLGDINETPIPKSLSPAGAPTEAGGPTTQPATSEKKQPRKLPATPSQAASKAANGKERKEASTPLAKLTKSISIDEHHLEGSEMKLATGKSAEVKTSEFSVAGNLQPLQERGADVSVISAQDRAVSRSKPEAGQLSNQEKTKRPDLTIDISKPLLIAEQKTDAEHFTTEVKAVTETQYGESFKEKAEKEDEKSDPSSSQQQKSPQGLSDTGYSSDGISSSLGEIPSLIPNDEKDLLKEPSKKDSYSQESSPSSPSDLAKLESTVLSILEAQVNVLVDGKSVKNNDLYGIYGDQTRDRQRTKPIPITPESCSSDEEDLEDIQEEDEESVEEEGQGGIATRKSFKHKIELMDDELSRRQHHDSLEDSSESEHSPVPQRKRRASVGSSSSDEYKREDSQGSGDDEEFIRKQIIEMSADEEASGSEDEEYLTSHVIEKSTSENQKKDGKSKAAGGKSKRLTKKSSTSYDEDGGRRHSWHDDDEETYDKSPEQKCRETKSQESEDISATGGGGLRRFKTIELNSTITHTYAEKSEKQTSVLYFEEEPELEMESLTDSPEDRSRGEGSSSLHGSSFTPGTSPTSVSSLDEDSDSSSSHTKVSSESKQQRKARHRSHGPVLPTIEDSSEEEELREEEELLKEQEKQREMEQQQRKGSSKKSKKDKDELRAQRRRERPKTPPSNLSPIEDASPTEELRQAAEMEELHRSSCSEYSPSIESEPEGFEICPEKILEVQKGYRLPVSVSLYSPTDEKDTVIVNKESYNKTLKSSDEACEKIMHKPAYQVEKERDETFEKEPLYGGMLIEDYIYESLVEDTYNGILDSNIEPNLAPSQDESRVFTQYIESPKQMDVHDDMCVDIVHNIDDRTHDYYNLDSSLSFAPQEDIVSSSYIMPESHEIVLLDSVIISTGEERPLLDADTAYEELMKRHQMELTPGSSPTCPFSEFMQAPETPVCTNTDLVVSSDKSLASSDFESLSYSPPEVSPFTPLSIPDVKITQHFTAEDLNDEFANEYVGELQITNLSESPSSELPEAAEGFTSVLESEVSTNTEEAFLVYDRVSSDVPTHDTSTEKYVSQRTDFEEVYSAPQTDQCFSIDKRNLLSGMFYSDMQNSGKTSSDEIVPIDMAIATKGTESIDHVIISVPDVVLPRVTVKQEQESVFETPNIPSSTLTVVVAKEGRSTSDIAVSSFSEAKHSFTSFDSASEHRSTHTASVPRTEEEVPINLSLVTSAQVVSRTAVKPGLASSVGITNGWSDNYGSSESVEIGAVDLSTSKASRTMVTVDETLAAVVTEIVDDEKPVDLTAGRRAVCCDVVYKLPFGSSCISQQPVTTLPEDRFGYRDDHYQYSRPGQYGYKGVGGMKPSMSDTNLAEAGLFFYKSRNHFDYHTDAAVDLTSSRVTTGDLRNYSSKTISPYPETRHVISGIGISAPQYSQARMTTSLGSQFGMGNVLRSSNGIVYSSVATPVPSTYAITTQPGSIFSTTVCDFSCLNEPEIIPAVSILHQNQPQPRAYNFITTLSSGNDVACSETQTGLQNLTLDAIASKQDEMAPVLIADCETVPQAAEDEVTLVVVSEDGNQQELHFQRELLELEKLQQQRFAEELEWERNEIQRFREQETFMVQRKLEELQSMKQHLLLQQEEERQAQFMMRQETLAQQQLHLEQIQQLQQQLHQQLEEQKIHQVYQYNYDPSGTLSPQTSAEQTLMEGQFPSAENAQFWTGDGTTTTASLVLGTEMAQNQAWYTIQTDGITQYIPRAGMLSSVSEMSLKDIDQREDRQLKKRSSMPRLRDQYIEQDQKAIEEPPRSFKMIVDSGVQTDDEDATDRGYTGRRKRTKKSVDSCVQTDDEDQDDWDIQTRSRRRSRVSKYGNGSSDAEKVKQFSKVSNIAVQTVAEMSVQTEPSGIIKTPSVRAQLDSKVEIVKHISAPEKSFSGKSLACQTGTESEMQSPQYMTDVSLQKDKRRPKPLEIGYSSHLRADSNLQVVPSPPKSPKVLYSPISPVSPSTVLESAFVPYEKNIVDDVSPAKSLQADIIQLPPPSPKAANMMQHSLSDPKPLSPTAEDESQSRFQYSDGYMPKTGQCGSQKKVKRTLPNPPPEEATTEAQSAYSTVGSVSRRRIGRTNTMARAKILQDIDRELDLVERESSKLRKKQAELDEEEKEIDAKLRYLEMGINRRKEALLKEREKRERAYLQGVAEDRDYMSDSEVHNVRPSRLESQHGLERPRTAPQTDFTQYMPPQTQSEAQFVPPTSPYTQYQYTSPALPTQAPTEYTQQSHYQQPLYHQHVSHYQTQPSFQAVPTISYTSQVQPSTVHQPSYQHPSQLIMMQQKPRQTALDVEPKLSSNYEVIRNQPLIIAPVSDSSYPTMGNKYSTLDLRMGLDERSSMASSPMSSISGDSFYSDLEHHSARNYVLIDDIGELTKSSPSLNSVFNLHEKDLVKADHLLRSVESHRTPEVTDFLTPIQAPSRLHAYGKTEEDSMEDPYELKLLKHQIKQEFRRGTENLEPLTGLSQYYPSDSMSRHFPKSEKYSISRLTLEKQAAKQLPPAIIYQKQSKHKKPFIDPKLSKFSPIQESHDLESEYASYISSGTSSVPGISSRARLLQDDITFGLRKNITDQQKYLGPAMISSLGSCLGTSLSPTMRSTLQDEVDKPYNSGSRSRPSSRPSSVYGLDLSIKRDLSSSSLRLKALESEALDVSFSHVAPSGRTKPSSLPISQSRGRIPIVAQNSEEESPLSPVGQPMGMARAAAGPLPPISADTRDQFGSSHSLPEVQQHMREESRTRGYERDIAFIMDDFQHAMSDSEDNSFNDAYHLRREETDWFDKPRDSRLENGHGLDRKLSERLAQSRSIHHQQEQTNGKPINYIFPHTRLKLQRDPKDHSVSGNGLGIRVIGGKEIPGNGEMGAYIAKILPGGNAEQTGRLVEGMQVLEWNGIPLTAKTYEEVQSIVSQPSGEVEICVRLDLNMLSDSEYPQHLELPDPAKPVEKKTKSPGVDPKQLAAELHKVSLQQAPSAVSSSADKGSSHGQSGATSAASSAVPSPGQPGSPSVSKKRHSGKPAEVTKAPSHPITGEIQLQINYDKHVGNLIIHILQARNLIPRDNNGYSDPFVKVYLLPGRGAEYKRRTKHVQKSLNPEWNQTVIYKNISMEQIKKKTLEVTVWDYDRFSSNDFLGEVLIDLSSTLHLDNTPRWYTLKEQSETVDHAKSHSGQGSQQVPKPSVIKSRSHGIFPDPSKDMQVPTIEKSHSSPGSSKSSSEGHLRSHGPSRSQSKTSVTQTHLEDAGAAIAAAEAAVQQLRLQPTSKPNAHRATESSVSTTSSANSFGSGHGMDIEGNNTTGENNQFPIPRIGKMSQNGQDPILQSGVTITDTEGKTQVMGEMKVALKKEMKTDGEQLTVEILQCRNITYKFKSPDHLPDLYVKLYVINLATQKRIIKKKTRVCRHDREPSFNETFRFSMNPAGHSLQILLVSNGGKFMKKTLIGEAYICLDKVDLRKRIVNWHKLMASASQSH